MPLEFQQLQLAIFTELMYDLLVALLYAETKVYWAYLFQSQPYLMRLPRKPI